MAAEVVEREAPEVDYSRIKRWVIKREGRDYVQYAGLVDLLHQETEGAFEILTRLEQAPTEGNGQTAIVSATVTMAGRTASGLGDANPGNVSRAMAPHTIRMAETRAKGRALRDLLNIGLVTVDELGPGADEHPAGAGGAGAAPRPVAPRTASFGGPVGPRPVPPAPPAQDAIEVDGRAFSREQVVAGKHRRIEQALAAGLFVPAMGAHGGPPPDDAPLSPQVEYSKELLRRLEARAGAARSSGS